MYPKYFQKAGRGTAPKSANAVTSEKIEQDVAEALAIIESNHVVGKKLNYNEVFKSSIDGMLHTLDPHSNYFDAKEFEQFRTDQSSRYYGIGATIGDLSDAKGKVIATYIRATFDRCPGPSCRPAIRRQDRRSERHVESSASLSPKFATFSAVRAALRRNWSSNVTEPANGRLSRSSATLFRSRRSRKPI